MEMHVMMAYDELVTLTNQDMGNILHCMFL